ncbi:MAG TPA: 2-oxoacid:acceptor oxidoreductase family protein [Bacillota bacterium]|nr:2-oxoacid:acceptor oxidoreductase family protein [Bacillota bacterium]
MAENVRIVLAGEGGQGVQAVAEIIAEAANGEGRQVLYIPDFGVEQRGGVSVAYVQVSDKPVGSPKFKVADIVVALSGRAVRRTRQFAGPDTVFIYDSGIRDVEKDLPEKAGRLLPIPAVETAKKELHPRVFNMIILGALLGATAIVPAEKTKAAIESKFGYKFAKQPELRELNFRAMERGMNMVQFSSMP